MELGLGEADLPLNWDNLRNNEDWRVLVEEFEWEVSRSAFDCEAAVEIGAESEEESGWSIMWEVLLSEIDDPSYACDDRNEYVTKEPEQQHNFVFGDSQTMWASTREYLAAHAVVDSLPSILLGESDDVVYQDEIACGSQ